jgi:Zn-dependent protease with chaperone function
MRKLAILLFLFVNYCVSAQNLMLTDTLTTAQKKDLSRFYENKKNDFLKNLSVPETNKKELQEIKMRFKTIFEDFDEAFKKNKLIDYKPINEYFNQLLAEIKKANPEIPDIHILVSTAFHPNAYNTGEGTVVIDNYLLACLDSESQLLFILCHEIAHQTLQHGIYSTLREIRHDNSNELKKQTKNIKKQKYNRNSQAENLLKDIAYKNSSESRKDELQADSLGFVYFSGLKRDNQQIVRALESLRAADNEPDSLTIMDYQRLFADKRLNFDEKWFDMGDYSMYHYKKTNKYNTDSLRTHPNISERIAALPVTSNPEGTKFAETSVSDEFTPWHESAMTQNVYNEYIAEHYGNSLYEALKLYNRQPTPFLKEMIGKNFKKLYEAQKAYRLNRYVSQINVNDNTTSYNIFCAFINHLKLSELEAFSNYFNNEQK